MKQPSYDNFIYQMTEFNGEFIHCLKIQDQYLIVTIDQSIQQQEDQVKQLLLQMQKLVLIWRLNPFVDKLDNLSENNLIISQMNDFNEFLQSISKVTSLLIYTNFYQKLVNKHISLHFANSSFQKIKSLADLPQILRVDEYLQLSNQPLLQIDSEPSQSLDFRQIQKGRDRDDNDTVTESEVTTISVKNNQQIKLIELTDQPSTINGIMRPYQLEALQWLLDLHCYSNQYMIQMCKKKNINYQLSTQKFQYQANAILAYEMGLGKTLIAISLISQLLLSYGYKYPFLIIVPKSTLPQWQDEFKKFNNKIKVFSVIGDQQTRKEQLQFMLKNKSEYQVILTTYDVLHIEINSFKNITYEYVVFDEGHKLKNAETQISTEITYLRSYHKLLMTGTPIQNDLNELHSLLYALMPYIFSNAEEFVQIVQSDGENNNQNQQQNVELLQQILQHFILRRTKLDVEHLPKKTEFLITCPLTSLQKKLYKGILLKDSSVMFDAVNRKTQNSEILKTSLNNIMMQLRKCADHPYLFKGVEPTPQVDGDHLINVSGKMVVMMKLLDYITNQKNEKVLVFCQMTQLLNIISDTLNYKQYSFLRLDGSTSLEDRQKQLQLFNSENPKSPKIFLLSTRAGALGLNLTAANHLILVQSDPNPQVDLQAVGRVNRIGQKKPIFVYRLMSENTVDQRLYERAQIKLQLETLIMKNADFSGYKVQKKTNKQELMDMISTGGMELFNENDVDTTQFDYNQPEIQFSDDALQKMLKEGQESSEKIQKKVEQKEKSMYDVLKNLKQDGKLNELVDIQNLYEFQGQNFKELTNKILEQKRIIRETKYSSKYLYNEEDDKKETNYLTVAKFKRTEYYKPEFYLLDDTFYQLQDKIFTEITTVIKPTFEKPENSQLTYEQYVQNMQQGPDALRYINGSCPGLNQQELETFEKYKEIQCWLLNNQIITRVFFNSIIDTLFLDRLDEQLLLQYGIQRALPSGKLSLLSIISDEKAQEFQDSPILQRKYSFNLLVSNKKWKIAPFKPIKIDTFDNIDYQFHYQRLLQNAHTEVKFDAQQLEQFCKTYFEAYPDSDSTQKVKRGMDRLDSITLKFRVLSECIQSNINTGCQIDQLLYQLNYGKIYNLLGTGFSDLADKFLLLFTNIFGLEYFDVAQQIIKVLPCFALDFNLKSKQPQELRDRTERILKAMVKKYKALNGDNIKQNDK